jgi:hypothetical protein
MAVRLGYRPDRMIVIVKTCDGPWPIDCWEAWPVSRFAWCETCKKSRAK